MQVALNPSMVIMYTCKIRLVEFQCNSRYETNWDAFRQLLALYIVYLYVCIGVAV